MSNLSDGTSPATPPESWAEVRAHDRVTRYLRAGSGSTVVVLRADGGTALWPLLVEALAARLRVVIPELPPEGTDIASWLGAFLEGLGACSVGLVAAGVLCVPALERALSDEQIARLVLVPDDECASHGSTDAETLAERARGAAGLMPLLVMHRTVADAEAIARVDRFLRGELRLDVAG